MFCSAQFSIDLQKPACRAPSASLWLRTPAEVKPACTHERRHENDCAKGKGSNLAICPCPIRSWAWHLVAAKAREGFWRILHITESVNCFEPLKAATPPQKTPVTATSMQKHDASLWEHLQNQVFDTMWQLQFLQANAFISTCLGNTPWQAEALFGKQSSSESQGRWWSQTQAESKWKLI